MWNLATRRHITAHNSLDVKVACVTKNQNFMYNNKYFIYMPFFSN